jgi:3-hydroxyethyl bacteriochlorophyllide a dehydrogenase
MMTTAIVLEGPEQLAVRELPLVPTGAAQIVVDVEWSAVSTGTERLLWSGQMPPFPGMGYPLVPGYESVGRVVEADAAADLHVGDRVFVPGASCYGEVKGLFGGAASRLIVAASRVVRIPESLGEEGVLLALAATARHALAGGGEQRAELIVGHGVLGRLLARLAVCTGGSPVVWEKDPVRAKGAEGYQVIDPRDDSRKDYRSIYDVSGDPSLIDTLVGRLSRGGELVLAGFYAQPITFSFPLAFMKEARLRVAAEWQPEDLRATLDLITHRRSFREAPAAYATAFRDPECLKMLIEWGTCQ